MTRLEPAPADGSLPAWQQAAPRHALWAAIIVVVLMAVFSQTRLYYDYAWQLMSVRDYARGDSPSPFHIRFADPENLARDRLDWTIGYPLAYNAVGGLLTKSGLPPTAAHRVIAGAAVLSGILGFHFLLRDATRLPPLVRAGALLAVGLSFNGLHMICFMMPEAFLFATAPWQLWAMHQGVQPQISSGRRIWLLTLLGMTTGVAYTFRYLAPLAGIPLLACAAVWLLWRRPSRWLAAACALTLSAALPVAILSAANVLHVGSINSSTMPWGVSPHLPDLNQWLLAITGPVQALFGSAFVFGRVAAHLGGISGLSDFDAQQRWGFLLTIPSTLLAAVLIWRGERRSTTLPFALAGVVGTSVGLLILYSRSDGFFPQPDPRYFVGPALLIFPVLADALYHAWCKSARERVAGAAFLLPIAATLVYTGYAYLRNLRAPEFGERGGIIAEGGVNPVALRAAVASRLPAGSAPIVWMCFQPGVLYALDGRHVFESYAGKPVDYRAKQPVTLVVLREKSGGMHPSIYAVNFHHLDLAGHAPDFEHGGFDVFIRPIGPQGVIARSVGSLPSDAVK